MPAHFVLQVHCPLREQITPLTPRLCSEHSCPKEPRLRSLSSCTRQAGRFPWAQGSIPRRPIAAIGVGILLGVGFVGCSVGPKYHPPSPTLAPFHNAPSGDAYKTSAPSPPLDAWWTGFQDPQLTRVVQRALDQNLDLAAALARVNQARAVARQAGARYKPSSTLTAQDTSLHQSLESPLGRAARFLPGFDRDQNYYELGAGASWELDLFGQLRRGSQVASAEAQAAEAGRLGTRISVAAEAADAYFQIRGDQTRIALAQEQIVTDEHLLQLVRQRFDAGIATDREVAQTEALLSQARASVPPLRTSLEAEMNRLDVLMGAQPGTYATELASVVPISQIPPPPAVETPADVLRRRPDVIAAERKLAGSNARIGAALGGYYPAISLSALLGSESIAAGHLFQSVGFQPLSVAGLRWRLFDFGKVDAEVAQARGANAEALINYRQSVLRAAEDVEDAFMKLAQSQGLEIEVGREVDSLRRARDRSQEAYRAGVIALTDVLDANRQLLVAQDQLALARANSSRAAVELFRALGGGWKA